MNDLKYAIRQLAKRPGFTAAALVTIALGIGVNSAMFSVANGVLLRPLPYAQPDRVVMVWNRWVDFERTWLSEPELLDYRAGVSALEALAAFTRTGVNLTGDADAERLVAGIVSPEIFPVLGVTPVLGRAMTVDEGIPGRDQVVVLGHGLWQRRFGGDGSIIGQSVEINGMPREVIGVMPPAFRLPLDYTSARPTELWLPLALDPDSLDSRGSHYLNAVGRLRPGASAEQATAQLQAIARGFIDDGFVSPEARFTAFAVPVTDQVLGSIRPAVWVLVGTVGLVLLIACVNVANLLLAQAETRRREFAVRVALGAARRRLIRQLVVESATLAVIGGGLGLILAAGGLASLEALSPANLPRVDEIAIDGRVLAFTSLVALLSVLLFGVGPAFRTVRRDLHDTLREGARGATIGGERQRLRRLLVAAQLALAVVLLLGAGLTLRSFAQRLAIDPGFRADRVLTARLTLPAADYPEPAQVTDFYDGLLESVRALPGVEAAGATRFLPLSGTMGDWTIEIEGREPAPGTDFDADWQVVTPGYFAAMGIPLVAGRRIEGRDRADGQQVVVINQQMVRDYWPVDDPLGKRIRFGGRDAPWLTIVGVVGDVRHSDPTEELHRTWYRPHAQFPVSVGAPVRSLTLTVRTQTAPESLTPALREAVRALDSRVPLSDIRSLTAVLGAAHAEPRFTMVLMLAFATLATVLATVGIYGVVAYAVRQRNQEIGIRMALGAASDAVLALVLRQGMIPVVAGLVAGLVGAWVSSGVLSGLLYGITPTDLPTYVGVTLLLALVALAACYIPARRATRVDPMEALRHE